MGSSCHFPRPIGGKVCSPTVTVQSTKVGVCPASRIRDYPLFIPGGRVRSFLVLFPLLSFASPVSIPLTFEERGPDKFLVRLAGGTASIRHDRVEFGSVTLRFDGARPSARVEPLGAASPATYMSGGTRRTFSQFPRVAIRGVYPGVDAIFYEDAGKLEYDLKLASGARVDRIRLHWDGVQQLHIDAHGDLEIGTLR